MAVFTSRKQQQNLKITFENDMLFVEMPDGKQQVFPLAFFPALRDASEEDRADWTPTGNGIRWNNLGLTIAV